jgi:hypothetical protein
MSPGDPPVVHIVAPPESSRRLWERTLELASALGEETRWALVGGLMVQLHAFEHQANARLTDDIDVLGDSRRRPSMTKEIAELLRRRGGQMATPSRGHRPGKSLEYPSVA